MKFSKTNLLMALIIGIPMLIAISACTKEGPTGPAGTNGKDANIVCGVCHNNNSDLSAKFEQYGYSLHGTNLNYDRNTTQCAPCHTQQGFRETIVSGMDSTMATIQNPNRQDCRTCHNIHTNYDSTDFSRTYTSPVKFRLTPTHAAFDFGPANLCAKCHQARTFSPTPDLTKPNDTISITSNRWGPHHSPVANVIAGYTGLEVTGNVAIPTPGSNKHLDLTNGKVCISCHMALPQGAWVGGHSWNMTYSDPADGKNVTFNTNACNYTGCHSKATTSYDYDGAQTATRATINQFRILLCQKGILDTTQSAGLIQNDLLKATSAKPLKLTNLQAAAVFTYFLEVTERSEGVHNYAYTTAILANSIDVINKMK